MTYIRTEVIDNSGVPYHHNIFKCDITGEEFGGDCPFFTIKEDTHISTTGFEVLMHQWIKRMNSCGLAPFILTDLIENNCKRNKRSTYINKNLVKEVLEKYKHKCNQCGSKERLEIDHIKPVVRGGETIYSNLQVLCITCNRKKGGKYDG